MPIRRLVLTCLFFTTQVWGNQFGPISEQNISYHKAFWVPKHPRQLRHFVGQDTSVGLGFCSPGFFLPRRHEESGYPAVAISSGMARYGSKTGCKRTRHCSIYTDVFRCIWMVLSVFKCTVTVYSYYTRCIEQPQNAGQYFWAIGTLFGNIKYPFESSLRTLLVPAPSVKTVVLPLRFLFSQSRGGEMSKGIPRRSTIWGLLPTHTQ